MMPITTSSSTRVKPGASRFRMGHFPIRPRWVGGRSVVRLGRHGAPRVDAPGVFGDPRLHVPVQEQVIRPYVWKPVPVAFVYHRFYAFMHRAGAAVIVIVLRLLLA